MSIGMVEEGLADLRRAYDIQRMDEEKNPRVANNFFHHINMVTGYLTFYSPIENAFRRNEMLRKEIWSGEKLDYNALEATIRGAEQLFLT